MASTTSAPTTASSVSAAEGTKRRASCSPLISPSPTGTPSSQRHLRDCPRRTRRPPRGHRQDRGRELPPARVAGRGHHPQQFTTPSKARRRALTRAGRGPQHRLAPCGAAPFSALLGARQHMRRSPLHPIGATAPPPPTPAIRGLASDSDVPARPVVAGASSGIARAAVL
jgi:hypothetical protein